MTRETKLGLVVASSFVALTTAVVVARMQKTQEEAALAAVAQIPPRSAEKLSGQQPAPLAAQGSDPSQPPGPFPKVVQAGHSEMSPLENGGGSERAGNLRIAEPPASPKVGAGPAPEAQGDPFANIPIPGAPPGTQMVQNKPDGGPAPAPAPGVPAPIPTPGAKEPVKPAGGMPLPTPGGAPSPGIVDVKPASGAAPVPGITEIKPAPGGAPVPVPPGGAGKPIAASADPTGGKPVPGAPLPLAPAPVPGGPKPVSGPGNGPAPGPLPVAPAPLSAELKPVPGTPAPLPGAPAPSGPDSKPAPAPLPGGLMPVSGNPAPGAPVRPPAANGFGGSAPVGGSPNGKPAPEPLPVAPLPAGAGAKPGLAPLPGTPAPTPGGAMPPVPGGPAPVPGGDLKDLGPAPAPAGGTAPIPAPGAPQGKEFGAKPIEVVPPAPVKPGELQKNSGLPGAPTSPRAQEPGTGDSSPVKIAQVDPKDRDRLAGRAVPPVGAPANVGSPPIRVPQPVDPPQQTTAQPNVQVIEVRTHRCTAADTSFKELSKKFYLSERYDRALLFYNRSHPLVANEVRLEPPQLRPGTVVYIPPVAKLERDHRDVIPGLPSESSVSNVSVSRAKVEPRDVGSPVPVAVAPPPGGTPSRLAPEPVQKQTPTSVVPVNGSAARGGTPYRVAPGGEPLYRIAQRTLGNGGRWHEIYRLNPNLNPEMPIPEGTNVLLPPDARVP